jgi:branched-chain amino acid transport system permease protein
MLVGQLIFDGFSMGLVFVILATGLVLIASVNKILFMAYGFFYTIGAYVTWYAIQTLDLPYFGAALVGVIGAGIIGIICYLLVFQRLQHTEGGFLATLISSMGLLMVLGQSGLLVFGTQARSIPNVFPGAFPIAGINIIHSKLFMIGVGLVVTLILFLIVERTALGRSMRAVSFLPETASLHGINSNWTYMITLAIGTAMAGIAGAILAPNYGLSPNMGNNIIWTVMLMTMLGGMDSLLGAVAAGVVIGQALSFGQFYIGGMIQVVVFAFIGIVLYFRPNGLMGKGIDIGI